MEKALKVSEDRESGMEAPSESSVSNGKCEETPQDEPCCTSE